MGTSQPPRLIHGTLGSHIRNVHEFRLWFLQGAQLRRSWPSVPASESLGFPLWRHSPNKPGSNVLYTYIYIYASHSSTEICIHPLIPHAASMCIERAVPSQQSRHFGPPLPTNMFFSWISAFEGAAWGWILKKHIKVPLTTTKLDQMVFANRGKSTPPFFQHPVRTRCHC